MKSTKGEYGEIRIHNEVIIAIVRRATLEVEGVEKIAVGFKKGIISLLGRKKFSRGVTIERNKDNDIKITVSVALKFGINIPEVVNEIQQNVRKMLEQITGIIPLEVNVEVERVVQEKELENVFEEIKSDKAKGGEDETKS